MIIKSIVYVLAFCLSIAALIMSLRMLKESKEEYKRITGVEYSKRKKKGTE